MEPNLHHLQKREAKKRAGNPFTAVLVIFLAISVCISIGRNGVEMKIWLGLLPLQTQVAMRKNCSMITVFNILLLFVALADSFHIN
jgi:hypothetical protein